MGGTQAETRAAGGQGTDSKEKTTPVLVAVWRGEPHVLAAVSNLSETFQPRNSGRAP